MDARFVGLVGIGLALACERGAPIAAPSTSRAGEFSASVNASAPAAHIGWEIFGSASATAADGLRFLVTGKGPLVVRAGGGGRSGEAPGGGTGGRGEGGEGGAGWGGAGVPGL